MSSPLDPAKLKVVELRQELSKRGLDSKGNKPALVKRLKDALKEELKEELPDTSIADTSTEEADTSQSQEEASEETEQPAEEACTLPIKEPDESVSKEIETEAETVTESKEIETETEETEVKDTPVENDHPPTDNDVCDTEEPDSQREEELEKDENITENTDVNEEEPKESNENISNENDKEMQETEVRGEKRKRSGSSPEKNQRARSKSPIKEDEPPIDNEKVQLSWYDSDLHLQVDKESFLAAKPYHEGAFGYAWAGVRATHGISTGKVWFEVKITEELKWEDFSKCYEIQENPSKSKSRTERHSNEVKNDSPHENGNNANKTSNVDVEMKEQEESVKESPEEDVKNETEEPKDNQEENTESEIQNEVAEDKHEDETMKEADPVSTPEEKEEKGCVEPIPTHLFRVGWSELQTGLQLGEEQFSFGYESTGKFVVNKTFQDYGIQFGVGDVIASFLHINEGTISISFAVNGEPQPEAISLPITDLPDNFVLFPHVLSRNYAFELNLGNKDCWFVPSDTHKEYTFLEHSETKIAGPYRPESRSECEVILMCGLPAAGKTHWIKEYVQANQDKKYTVLGSTHLLEKMTVAGDALKNKYKGSWTMLLEKLQKSLNKLIDLAALRRRNYIIDQPNVYPSAQRRKMRLFEGFKRRAVVVVVGDEEQTKRQSLQEAEGCKEVPDNILLDMKANMSLPVKGDWLDEVEYVGVEESEAKQLVQKYNSQARETLGAQRRYTHRDDRNRWQRRNDYRGGNFRDRNYYNRYDRAPRQGNWHPPRPGGWNRDRRDVRGPPMGSPRDWRHRGNGRDRSREPHSQGNNFNRNRNPPNRGPGGNWTGNWGGNQNWNNHPWPNQGSWGHSGWGGNQPNQNQWKYGGGSNNYSGYSNWNYYGQYPQNWNSQTQQHSTGASSEYGQYSQDWAQYAQQQHYAQPDQQSASVAGQIAQPK